MENKEKYTKIVKELNEIFQKYNVGIEFDFVEGGEITEKRGWNFEIKQDENFPNNIDFKWNRK